MLSIVSDFTCFSGSHSGCHFLHMTLSLPHLALGYRGALHWVSKPTRAFFNE